MVVGPEELAARADAIAGIDRRDVRNVLEDEIDRVLATQGAYQLSFWGGIVIHNPADLVARRLPYISKVERIVGEVFNESLKGKYEASGWKADYHAAIPKLNNPEQIIFYKKK